MQVFFTSRDPEAASLRDLVVERIRFGLRRFSTRVPRATVQLSDLNGPRGGIDKHCRIELLVGGGTQRVVVTTVAADWRTALNDALSRAVRHTLRTLDRTTGRRDRPLRLMPQS
jgi:hypothetical protein